MTKEEKYLAIQPRIRALLAGETDEVARMSNMAAALHGEFDFWWTGFYRVASAEELVLGPFQGPVACMRITKGRGVCGTSWSEERTVVVKRKPQRDRCALLETWPDSGCSRHRQQGTEHI